jgi:hypothetical protein
VTRSVTIFCFFVNKSLQAATAATVLLASAVGRNRSDILCRNVSTRTSQRQLKKRARKQSKRKDDETSAKDQEGQPEVRWNTVEVSTDTANLQTSTSEGTERGLSTRTRSAAAVTASRAELDVQGSDAELTATKCHVLCSKHRGVGARLVTISLHLHATSAASNSFATREISHVLRFMSFHAKPKYEYHEGVVERSIDVGNAEDVLPRSYSGRTKVHN